MPTFITEHVAHLITSGKVSEAMSLLTAQLAPETTLSQTQLQSYIEWLNKTIFTQHALSIEILEPIMQFTHQLSQNFAIQEQPISLSHTLLISIQRRITYLAKTAQEKESLNHILIIFLKTQPNPVESLIYLSKTQNSNTFEALLHALESAACLPHHSELLNWLHQLRLECLQTYNISLFNRIETIIVSLFTEEALMPLSPELIEKRDFLNRCPAHILEQLHSLVHPLITGHFQLAKIVPFILAAIREDKEEAYIFTPTLLVEKLDEPVSPFNLFLESLAMLTPPVKERFIRVDEAYHWTCGEIEIDNEDHVNIFISDANFNANQLLKNLETTKFTDYFSGKNVTLYLNGQLRQNQVGSCLMFALSDLRSFYTLERYGPQENLFTQLDQRILEETHLEDGTHVRVCTPPLALIRSMQSRKVFPTIEAERDRIVNKRGQPVIASTLGFFSHTESGQPFQNIRIAKKQEKIIKRLDQWIMRHLQEDPVAGYQYINDMAKRHELAAFQSQLASSSTHRSEF